MVQDSTINEKATITDDETLNTLIYSYFYSPIRESTA